MNNVKMYNIDLTLTDDCNFRCSYCFEEGFFNKKYFSDTDLFIKRVDEFLDSFFFKNNYNLLNIGFWGGEPTLNKKAINKIFKYYSRNGKVKFFIYSNGSKIDSFIDLLEEYSQVRLLDRKSVV